MVLTKLQIKSLRTLAHDLKPVVRIGQNGLTENVMEEIKLSLKYHELIKVKINVGDRIERDQLFEKICLESRSQCVQKIGSVAVLFRRNAQKPVITLSK